jgi:hypothetical protein
MITGMIIAPVGLAMVCDGAEIAYCRGHRASSRKGAPSRAILSLVGIAA